MGKLLFLNSAQRFGDFALLLLRLFVGLFLIWSVWDHVTDAQSMREYVVFLANHNFPSPEILARVSTYAQLLIGIAFVLGVFTRWAGIFCVVHFVVAIAYVDHLGGLRETFPSGCLVFIGLYLATHGAGPFSMDAVLHANDRPRSGGGITFKK
jgi:putative oxidoreductase